MPQFLQVAHEHQASCTRGGSLVKHACNTPQVWYARALHVAVSPVQPLQQPRQAAVQHGIHACQVVKGAGKPQQGFQEGGREVSAWQCLSVQQGQANGTTCSMGAVQAPG